LVPAFFYLFATRHNRARALSVKLQILNARRLEGLFLLIEGAGTETERINQDVHDAEDTEHDKKPYDPPNHMLLALRSLFFVAGAADVFHDTEEEDHERNNEGKLYERVDDLGIQFANKGINRISICDERKHVSEYRYLKQDQRSILEDR
jgi:hypothetical protein